MGGGVFLGEVLGEADGGFGADVGAAVFLIGGFEEGHVVGDDLGLDEDDELAAFVAVDVLTEEFAEEREATDVGHALAVVLFLFGDEATEDDGFAIGNGDGGDDLFGADDGDVVGFDALAADDGVVDLGDGEVDLAVSIDEGNDFEFEDDVAVFDGGGDVAGVGAVADEGRGLGWDGDELTGGDGGFFVVEGEDGWAGEDFEAVAGFEGVDEDVDAVTEGAVEV